MRKTLRASYIAVVSLLGVVVLAIGSAFSAAVAFGAIGLLVPGTGTPDANNVSDYMENARDWYMQGTACNDAVNCGTVEEGVPNPTLQGIDYPASFWPLAIFPSWCRSGPDGCDKWDESVGKGAAALTTALEAALATPGTPGERDIVMFGYSQGGAVLSKVLREYGLTEEEKARLDIVTIGGIENPDGGLWQRLAFLRYIPILNVTFAPPMPVDPSIKTTTYGFEYDPVVYAPRYWGNPFAMLNAIAAFDNVHGYYLSPNGNGPTDGLPYGYTPATLAPHLVCEVGVNCRVDEYGNEYIMIPATSLPIMNLVMSLTPDLLKPLVKPIIDLISPAYKVLADLGYDWSGDPGKSTPLSILPFKVFQDWSVVAGKLVGAVIQGVEDMINGGPRVAPTTVPDTSVLAARSSVLPSDEAPLAKSTDVAELATVTELKPADGSVAEEAPAPVTEPIVVEVDSAVEPIETVEETTPVETVTEEQEPVEETAEVTEPEETEAGSESESEPVQDTPEKAEKTEKAGKAGTEKVKKIDAKKVDAKKIDAKKTAASEDSDSGADKKAAA